MKRVLVFLFLFCEVIMLRAQTRNVYDTLINGHKYYLVSYRHLKYKITVWDSVDYPSHLTSNPEFSGELNKWASDSIHYSDDDILAGRRVLFVGFVIQKSGSISDVKILRGVNSYFDNEVRKDISMMPKWKPGIRDGHKVATHMIFGIVFMLIEYPSIIMQEHEASWDSVY